MDKDSKEYKDLKRGILIENSTFRLEDIIYDEVISKEYAIMILRCEMGINEPLAIRIDVKSLTDKCNDFLNNKKLQLNEIKKI